MMRRSLPIMAFAVWVSTSSFGGILQNGFQAQGFQLQGFQAQGFQEQGTTLNNNYTATQKLKAANFRVKDGRIVLIPEKK